MTSPIIDASSLLPWHRRALASASTAILWAGWLCLWLPLLRAWAALAHAGARVAPAVAPAIGKLLADGSGETLRHSVVALLGASGTLIAWNRLPAPRSRAGAAASACELARHPGLAAHELRAGRQASVCVVHHDEHGRIVRVERPDPAPRGERRSA